MKKLFFILSYFGINASKHIKIKFIFIILLSISSTLLISIQPVIMAKLVSEIEQRNSELSALLVALALGYISLMCLRKLSSAMIAIMIVELRSKLTIILSDNYMRNIFQKGKVNDNENTGDITQRLNQASDELSIILRNTVQNLFPPILQLIFSIIVILLNGSYTVATLFLLYFIIYFSAKMLFNKKIINMYNMFYCTSVKKYSVITDSIKNISAARACNSYSFLFSRYKKLLEAIEKKHTKLLREDIKFLTLESFFNVVFFGTSFLFSLYQALYGQISLGQFVMIASYILMLSGPLEVIGSMFTALVKSTASLHTFINDIKQENDYSTNHSFKNNKQPELLLSNIMFSYEANSTPIIDNFDLHIIGPRFVTLTGASGTGKSTLARLISREITPDSGEVNINGRALSEFSHEELAETLYHVSQNDWIFMDTLRFNLLIACPDATDAQLLAALEFAMLNDLHDGEGENMLDMTIGDSGLTLSGGQRQRLSLARLFLRNPTIILLDEVTSALDVINESRVLNNIKQRFPQSIIMSISHRYTTFHYSDEIIVLSRDGQGERGTLPALLEGNRYIQSVIENSGNNAVTAE